MKKILLIVLPQKDTRAKIRQRNVLYTSFTDRLLKAQIYWNKDETAPIFVYDELERVNQEIA